MNLTLVQNSAITWVKTLTTQLPVDVRDPKCPFNDTADSLYKLRVNGATSLMQRGSDSCNALISDQSVASADAI